MTFAEMTPESWRLLCWLAAGMGFMWCGYALLRHLYGGKDNDDPRPDGPDER